MLIKQPDDIRPNDITDEVLYQQWRKQRRRFLRDSAALTLAACGVYAPAGFSPAVAKTSKDFGELPTGPFSTDEKPNPWEDITTYNNFYEFSTDKSGPAELAKNFQSRPWTLEVGEEAGNARTWDVDELIRRFPPEERVYRLRCVEAWSMVVPWVGFPLADLIRESAPTSRAKFVEFETLHDPQRMPGQKPGLFGSVLNWPYREGLRIDEAMHPLTILAVGLYGKFLPGQNGAPIRLVVPWKYGFKSIKSIVTMRFVEKQPLNTWQEQAANEYGFYSNVNPQVDHPRWSQARERRVGEFGKRPTLMFNGYAEQVAHLYDGMDLRKYY